MNVMETTGKLIKGDLSALLSFFKDNKKIHPAEIAKLLNKLQQDKAIQAYYALPTHTQVKIFPYLYLQLQQRIIKTATPTRAGYI